MLAKIIILTFVYLFVAKISMITLTRRHIVYDQYKKIHGTGQLIVITGQRRSGKSTFLRLLTQEYSSYFVDFELLAFDVIKTYQQLYDSIISYLSQHVDTTLVAIDEIQHVVQREKALLSLIKEYPQVTFVVTGSNSHLLASDLTTNLRGRFFQIHLFPFSYEEYCEAIQQEKSQTSFISYLEQGGFPSVYTLDAQQQKERSHNLINTIFINDIVERYGVRQPSLLKEIFLYLVFNTGNLTNISTIADYLVQQGITTNRNTVANYVDYLVQAYMIYPLPVYDIRGKKIFDKMMKYIPSDHSRRKLLFGSFDPGMGKILESLVAVECMRRGWDVRVGRIVHHEIDFVITKGSDKKYIQVAYLLATPEVIEREFGALARLNDNYPKYVISADPIHFGQQEGVLHVRAREMDTIFSTQ